MGKARATLLLTLAPVACSLVMMASCTTFDTEPPVADASSDATASDGPPIGPDGSPPDVDAAPPDPPPPALEPTCPAPPGGIDKPTAWQKRSLFVPPAGGPKMFPFAIATDATHVTWATQIEAPGALNPYDGVGDGMIMRVPKDGSGTPVILATSQRFTRALALDGIFAYWVTYGEDNYARLMRTPRGCVVSCGPPEERGMFPRGNRIDRIKRAVDGVLFAISDSGNLFRIDVTSTTPTLVYAAAGNAGLAVTTSAAYASAMDWPAVGKAPVAGGAGADLFRPAPDDAGPVGVVPIATDCASLWMVRESTPPIVLEYALGSSPSRTTLPMALPIGAFDLAADDRWLYFGAANAGGLYLVEKMTGTSNLLQGGNVWRIAVDRDGVYYGEHDRNSGTGNLYMLVKK